LCLSFAEVVVKGFIPFPLVSNQEFLKMVNKKQKKTQMKKPAVKNTVKRGAGKKDVKGPKKIADKTSKAGKNGMASTRQTASSSDITGPSGIASTNIIAGKTSTRKLPTCAFCHNHGQEIERKDKHKENCRFSECPCEKCHRTRENKKWLCLRRKLDREKAQDEGRNLKKESSSTRKIQTCSRCKFHGDKNIPLKGHKEDCPRKDCKCDGCALIRKIQIAGASKQKLRRAKLQDGSKILKQDKNKTKVTRPSCKTSRQKSSLNVVDETIVTSQIQPFEGTFVSTNTMPLTVKQIKEHLLLPEKPQQHLQQIQHQQQPLLEWQLVEVIDGDDISLLSSRMDEDNEKLEPFVHENKINEASMQTMHKTLEDLPKNNPNITRELFENATKQMLTVWKKCKEVSSQLLGLHFN
jgi:hypothetical protein